MAKVYFASDHAGFELKNVLVQFVQDMGHEVLDFGPHAVDPQDDYPDFCIPLARQVASEAGSLGIVLGMSGQGEAMAVNRIVGCRAVVYYGGAEEILTLSREHNNANVLSLGAHFLSEEIAKHSVGLWLGGRFSGEERHARRIAKLDHV